MAEPDQVFGEVPLPSTRLATDGPDREEAAIGEQVDHLDRRDEPVAAGHPPHGAGAKIDGASPRRSSSVKARAPLVSPGEAVCHGLHGVFSVWCVWSCKGVGAVPGPVGGSADGGVGVGHLAGLAGEPIGLPGDWSR